MNVSASVDRTNHNAQPVNYSVAYYFDIRPIVNQLRHDTYYKLT